MQQGLLRNNKKNHVDTKRFIPHPTYPHVFEWSYMYLFFFSLYADPEGAQQQDNLMEKLRQKCGQARSWSETSKALRIAINVRKTSKGHTK